MSAVRSITREATPERDTPAGGTQDTSGWGLAGLTLGIVAGFLGVYYLVVPLFPKVRATGPLTLMTVLAVAGMTFCGTVGYQLTRRR